MNRLLKKLYVRLMLKVNPSNIAIDGACKQCGNCCRNLLLVDDHQIIKDAASFERLKKKLPIYKIFRRKTIQDDGQWVFKCTKLTHHNTCSIHDQRPPICSNYPTKQMLRMNGELLEGCGYNIRPALPFDTILEAHE